MGKLLPYPVTFNSDTTSTAAQKVLAIYHQKPGDFQSGVGALMVTKLAQYAATSSVTLIPGSGNVYTAVTIVTQTGVLSIKLTASGVESELRTHVGEY